MRKEVSFDSRGSICRGWLYLPDGLAATAQVPAVVMAHGFSAVKEQILPEFAERFAASGFAVLLFDYRHFGDSAGMPRSQMFPLDMVEDYRNAISCISDHEAVDAQRVGVWGTSYSGGLAVYVGTFDKRVKAVVAQVPSIINADARRAIDPVKWAGVGDFLREDRIARYKTGVVKYMPVVAPEGEACILPGQETYDAYMALKALAPNWRNEITVESLEKIREFDPVSQIHLMAPAALLVIAAEEDSLIPLAAVKASYERAAQPKQLIVLPIRHFDVYQPPWREKVVDAAIDWFSRYLV